MQVLNLICFKALGTYTTWFQVLGLSEHPFPSQSMSTWSLGWSRSLVDTDQCKSPSLPDRPLNVMGNTKESASHITCIHVYIFQTFFWLFFFIMLRGYPRGTPLYGLYSVHMYVQHWRVSNGFSAVLVINRVWFCTLALIWVHCTCIFLGQETTFS